MEESVQKEGVRENASVKDLRPCNRVKRRLRAKKRKDILIVKGGERGGTSICGRPVKEGIYLTFQVVPDIASTFCSKKE